MRLHLKHHYPVLMLVGLAAFRPWLEATMARHMGIELPMLFALGWLIGVDAAPGFQSRIAPWNSCGLSAGLLALLGTSFWMIPAALDVAVASPVVAIAKVVSVVTAGMLAGAAWDGAEPAVRAFFVLNWAWMTLGVGLVYQAEPQRLCNAYLIDDQGAAGNALVAWSAVVLCLWGRQAYLSRNDSLQAP